MRKQTHRYTKHIGVHVYAPVTSKKRGSFALLTKSSSMNFGLREARTVYAALRDFFVPPERRGKKF